MLVKIIGASLIIFSCTGYGYLIKCKHLIRIKELENMMMCLDVIEREITVNLSNIYEAIKCASEHASKLNYNIFNNVLVNYENLNNTTFSTLWKDSLNKAVGEYNIYNKNDIETLVMFGNMLGAGNAETQEKNILTFKDALKKLIESATENNKKINLSTKMGAYVGIIISVLLI